MWYKLYHQKRDMSGPMSRFFLVDVWSDLRQVTSHNPAVRSSKQSKFETKVKTVNDRIPRNNVGLAKRIDNENDRDIAK